MSYTQVPGSDPFQALQFLSAHRDTVVLLLKNNAEELTLTITDEMRLLVSLCSTVVHLVSKSELVSKYYPLRVCVLNPLILFHP